MTAAVTAGAKGTVTLARATSDQLVLVLALVLELAVQLVLVPVVVTKGGRGHQQRQGRGKRAAPACRHPVCRRWAHTCARWRCETVRPPPPYCLAPPRQMVPPGPGLGPGRRREQRVVVAQGGPGRAPVPPPRLPAPRRVTLAHAASRATSD